ncbi:hypothetical protein QC763_310720 [Podospora pseudopauciseta]|uniref:C2H2-type domain-containing protein n=2 Tax=Podospora TaxID=5144 RepID=A0ABR0HHX7_9PEZI|nr:hypothetical protein QC763_310720 [Podospora pseudopauciseta]KAK4678844.1 hypothetical protein QC764_310720 [Podospora pseudoanserina]
MDGAESYVHPLLSVMSFDDEFKLRANWVNKLSSQEQSSRSPSPSSVTPSEGSSTNFCEYAASTTSSWATSAGPGTEYGFHEEEEVKPGANELPKIPPQRPETPADRLNRSLGRSHSPSLPSSLRKSFSAADREGDEADEIDEDVESDFDADESGCETARLDEEDDEQEDNSDQDDDDDEWSGENGNLESLVISAVDKDYSLAAFLIPLLHRDFNLALKSKVENWRCAASHAGAGDGAKHESSPANTSPSQGSGSGPSRKRRRTDSDEGARDGRDKDQDEEDQKDPGGGKMGPPSTPLSGNTREPLLACPFHKRDPIKYNVHGDAGSGKKHRYRPCTGPGFKSIQRLKEHLKRTHSPVQCERCKETFNPGKGVDRAESLNKLAEHRKSEVPCPLRDASLKEGVDEVQWAMLDKQNRKKNQEVHRVEKWFEIWDVLFPEVARPESPWHEIPSSFTSGTPKDGEEYFVDLFFNILDHKIQQGDIPLPGSDPADPNSSNNRNLDLLRDRLKTVVQNTFRMYVSIRENLSPETSSSQSQSLSHGHNRQPSSTYRSTGTGSLSASLLQPPLPSTAPTSVTSGTPQQQQQSPAATYLPPGAAYGMAHSQFMPAVSPAAFTGMADDGTATAMTASPYFFHAGNNMFTPQGYWLHQVPAAANHPHAVSFPHQGHLQTAAETWLNWGHAGGDGEQ